MDAKLEEMLLHIQTVVTSIQKDLIAERKQKEQMENIENTRLKNEIKKKSLNDMMKWASLIEDDPEFSQGTGKHKLSTTEAELEKSAEVVLEMKDNVLNKVIPSSQIQKTLSEMNIYVPNTPSIVTEENQQPSNEIIDDGSKYNILNLRINDMEKIIQNRMDNIEDTLNKKIEHLITLMSKPITTSI